MATKIKDKALISSINGDEKIPVYDVQNDADGTITPTMIAAKVMAGPLMTGLTGNIQDQIDTLDAATAAAIADLEDTKQDIESLASAGSDIRFDKPRVYGSEASPLTSAVLTYQGALAKLGVEVLVIHLQNPAPAFDTEFIPEGGVSQPYSLVRPNYIWMKLVCVTPAIVHYRSYST